MVQVQIRVRPQLEPRRLVREPHPPTAVVAATRLHLQHPPTVAVTLLHHQHPPTGAEVATPLHLQHPPTAVEVATRLDLRHPQRRLVAATAAFLPPTGPPRLALEPLTLPTVHLLMGAARHPPLLHMAAAVLHPQPLPTGEATRTRLRRLPAAAHRFQ